MATTTERSGRVDLSEHGIRAAGRIHWNPTTSMLYSHALGRRDGVLAEGGPLVVDTGVHTGRSPKDKFVVREPGSEERIWWGDVNQPVSEESFDSLREKVVSYLEQRDELYVVDAFAGADPAQRIAVRVITDLPYHALFAKTMFIDPTAEEHATFVPGALVLHEHLRTRAWLAIGLVVLASATGMASHPTARAMVIRRMRDPSRLG